MWLLTPPCELYTATGTSLSPDRINFAGPYVTSVGGTTGRPEEVASFFSGGGFSNHFPALAYQRYDVNAYVWSLGDKYPGRYACVRSNGLT